MIRQIAEKLKFPADAVDHLTEAQEHLFTNARAVELLGIAKEQMFTATDLTYMDTLSVIAAETGINRYTLDMLFFLSCADRMRALYAEKGIDESIYWASLSDLKYKLIECKNLHGVYGSFTKNWFPRFLRAEAFALGRLQYEYKPFPMEAYGDLLKQGDIVCNCHIPSSGTLLKEDVMASLKMAYDFYPQYRRNGLLPITCNSWLLYPPVAELFKKGSNMDRFYKIFEILNTKEQEHNTDFWRIFNLPFSEENLQNAPEDSSLQRSIKAFLQAGNHLGAGLGIILFDGENILTQR